MTSTDLSIVSSYGGPLLLDITYRRKWLGETRVLVNRHLPVMRQANLAGMIVPLDSIEDVSTLLVEVREADGLFRVVKTPDELEQANAEGAVGLFLCASCYSVGANLDLLVLLETLGVRMFALAYNPRNLLTDGCGEDRDAGLSHLGVNAVRKLAELGMLIDLSHTSDFGVEDVLRLVDGPVIASHSNCRAICGNARNLTDAQIRAIAATGGCVGATVHPSLIDPGPDPTVADYVAHLDHMLRLVGEDHVCLGTDFIDYEIDLMKPKLRAADPRGAIYHKEYVHVKGLESLANMPDALTLLLSKGHRPAAIRKIARDNVLRVLQAQNRERGEMT